MKQAELVIIGSLMLALGIFGIICVDLVGGFSFSDGVFVVVFCLFALFVRIQRTRSDITFLWSASILTWMGLSYIPTGASVVSERMGEWFYLFFVFGLLQYAKEAWHAQSTVKISEKTNWDTYYTKRIGSKHQEHTIQQLRAHAQWYINWMNYIQKKISIYDPSLCVFEIGSGMGGVITLLHKQGVSVVGSDISATAAETFKHISPMIPYRAYDVQKTQSFHETYDRVLAFEVLEHLTKLDSSVKNIYRMLRKGGYFVGTTPYPYPHVIAMPTHVNVHGPDFWRRLFQKKGFHSVMTYPMSLPPFLWRIHSNLNIVVPLYIPFSGWISTTLIIAKK